MNKMPLSSLFYLIRNCLIYVNYVAVYFTTQKTFRCYMYSVDSVRDFKGIDKQIALTMLKNADKRHMSAMLISLWVIPLKESTVNSVSVKTIPYIKCCKLPKSNCLLIKNIP